MKYKFAVKKQDGWCAIQMPTAKTQEIRAVHVRRVSGARPVVTYAQRLPLDGRNAVLALTELSQQWAGKRYHCTTMMAPNEYRILPVEAPKVPPSELRAAVRWLVKDMIDYEIEEAVIDVLSVPVDRVAPQRAGMLYAVAARKKQVLELQETFAQTPVPLEVIDVPELAQRNVASLAEIDGRGLALVYFDASGGLLTFTMGGELYLSRRIDVTITELQLEDSEARLDAQERAALEIQRSLDYFGRHFKNVVLTKLMVAPTGELDGRLVAFLGESIDLPVEEMKLELLLDLSAVPDLRGPAQQQRFFLPLGLALRLEERAL